MPVLYKAMLQRIKEGGQASTALVRELSGLKKVYAKDDQSLAQDIVNKWARTREWQEVPIVPGTKEEPLDRSKELSLVAWTQRGITRRLS